VIDLDFSSYDSSQTEMCRDIESMVVRKSAPCDVSKIWDTIGASDLNIQFSGYKMFAKYCKASGSKSTSWGNTFINFAFVIHTLLRARGEFNIQES